MEEQKLISVSWFSLKRKLSDHISIIRGIICANEEVIVAKQIERIHNEISQHDEIKEIIFPTYLIELGGYSTEKTKQLIEDENSENTWCNSIYANEDGSLTLAVTETQVENWKENIKTLVAEEKERFAKIGIGISISSDFQKLDYSFSNENSFILLQYLSKCQQSI